jgi:hypothetical protein
LKIHGYRYAQGIYQQCPEIGGNGNAAVMKVPKSFVRVVFLSGGKDGPAEAIVGNVPEANRSRYGSAGDISPGDSVE